VLPAQGHPPDARTLISKRRIKMSIAKRSLSAALLGSIALFLIVASLPPSVVQGRSPSTRQLSERHVHAQLQNNTPTNLVIGRENPELVSDSAAYRLFFLAVSTTSDSTPEDVQRQRDILSQRASFNDEEILFANQALTDFRTQFDQLTATYNTAAIAALNNNQTAYADLKVFLAKRDALVQSTREKLATGVSSNSLLNLHAHVQREKSNMTVALD